MEDVNDLCQNYKMRQDGKRLKKKELSRKLLWNEGLAESRVWPPGCEEKAIGPN
jgi:hypothetical protein